MNIRNLFKKPMEQSQSPLPNKPDQSTMDFPAAIKEVIDGKKIHKLEWKDKEYYGWLNGNILSLHKPDTKNYQWVLNDGDLKGNDYIVV